MKLKTKIMWISSIAVFVTLLVSDVIIFTLVRKSYIDEAVASATSDLQQVVNEFNASINNPQYEVSNTYVSYVLKKLDDKYNIAFEVLRDVDKIAYQKEIYNYTIFTIEELSSLKYDNFSRDFSYTFYNYKGEHYIVFNKLNNIGSYIEVYRVADITYVWDKLRILIIGMLIIMVVVILVVELILSRVLNKVLKPLKDLNQTANSIANGDYNHRVEISSSDEIGELGESFNMMAEAVEQRTNTLQESEHKKTLFMGDLTHELKTPMTAISGYSQLLLTTKLSDEDREEALTYIYQECGRLERLSKKMMKLLELDYEDALELREIPVSELFEAVSKSCSQLLKNKNMTLECEENGECFMVDPDLMTDALINLVDNGIKASTEGSRIILKASEKQITVQDFGKGIPKSEQDKILEPFYMIDKSRSRQSGGAGLGLALTATIIKKHNCKLVIESEIGKGTSMNLQFV
ncbi:MAG: HAMP domain-containing histidine kinase [Lachnospiraceae bacterium]|nr:HAMP domain-containing histidine kinase [Lachnospiraceae bacterium]